MRCNAERWELNKYCTLRWDSRFASSVVTAVTLKPMDYLIQWRDYAASIQFALLPAKKGYGRQGEDIVCDAEDEVNEIDITYPGAPRSLGFEGLKLH